jgi:hypothetical protein
MNFGWSRTSQMLAKVALHFSEFHFCFTEREEKKTKKKKKENQLSRGWAGICWSAVPRLLGLLFAIKS